MKFIIVFAAVIALAYGKYKINDDLKAQLAAELVEVVAKCVEQEKPSDADIKEMEEDKVPTTQAGKCMVACIFQELGAQGKDGTFTEEALLETLEPYKGEDMTLYNDMKKVLVDTCLPEIKSTERCEAAMEMSACYDKNATPEMVDADGLF